MSTTSPDAPPALQNNPPPMPGVFSWNELNTRDKEAAAQFYREVMGWGTVFFSSGGQDCTLLTMGPYRVGGIVQNASPDLRSTWLPYVQVENVEVTLAKAVELGAKVVWPIMDVPQVGRIGVFEDLQGAMLGLFQPEQIPPPA